MTLFRGTVAALSIALALGFPGALLHADVDKDRRGIESEVESQVASEIRKYYPSLKFLIAADATVTERRAASSDDTRDVLLPGVNGFQSKHGAVSQDPQTVVRVDRISVKILVDSSATRGDRGLAQLLENIAFYVGKLNRLRGDRVDIQEIGFPAQQHASLTPPSAGDPDTAQRRIASARPGADPAVAEAKLSMIDMILLGVILVSFAVSVILYFRLRRTVKTGASSVAVESERSVKASEVLQQGDDDREQIERLRSRIIMAAVGNGPAVVSLMRQLLASSDRAYVVSTTFAVLGNGFHSTIGHLLADNEVRDLKQSSNNALMRPMKEIRESLATFADQLASAQIAAVSESQMNPFGFLKNLSEAQLYVLIKDERPGIAAIILSQLPAPLAGNLIRNFASMRQGEIALEMARLSRLDSNVYVSIAKEMATKAAAIPVINNIDVQGTDILMEIMDNLDEHAEESISEFIKMMNLDLYREISSQRMTFEETARLSDKTLREIFREIPGEVVASALGSTTEEVRKRYLSVLPAKSRQMMNDLLASHTEPEGVDSQQARRRVLRLVRDYARRGMLTQAKSNGA